MDIHAQKKKKKTKQLRQWKQYQTPMKSWKSHKRQVSPSISFWSNVRDFFLDEWNCYSCWNRKRCTHNRDGRTGRKIPRKMWSKIERHCKINESKQLCGRIMRPFSRMVLKKIVCTLVWTRNTKVNLTNGSVRIWIVWTYWPDSGIMKKWRLSRGHYKKNTEKLILLWRSRFDLEFFPCMFCLN